MGGIMATREIGKESVGAREFQENILVGDMFGSGEERVWLWGS